MATLVDLFGIKNDPHVAAPSVVPVLIEVLGTTSNLPIDVSVQIVSGSRLGDIEWLRSDYASASVAGSIGTRHPFCINARTDHISYQSCEGGCLPVWHASERVNTAYFCAYATVDFEALQEQIREKSDGEYVTIRVREDPSLETVLEYFLLTEAHAILDKYETQSGDALDSSQYITQDGANVRLSLPLAQVTERLDEIRGALMIHRQVMSMESVRVVFTPINGCTWDQVVAHEHRHAEAGVGIKELASGGEVHLGITLRVTVARRHCSKRQLTSSVRME